MLAGNTLVDVALDMDIVRMVKTPEEIRRLRRATEITVKAHESFRAAIKPGNTDEDLTRAALARMIAEGADGVHFINVGCGPKTSFAAHSPFPTGHVMQVGDFVKVDMGAMYRGYPGDFVRSYFIGHATDRHKEIWARLNEVQLELGAWLKPGVTGGECFQRGYDHISRYLKNFPREFVGHGLGLNPHEQPRMNQVNRTVLEPNTVICIEYSYYHDGVRHHTEDTFLVKADGVEHWTTDCPRELVVPVYELPTSIRVSVAAADRSCTGIRDGAATIGRLLNLAWISAPRSNGSGENSGRAAAVRASQVRPRAFSRSTRPLVCRA